MYEKLNMTREDTSKGQEKITFTDQPTTIETLLDDTNIKTLPDRGATNSFIPNNY